MFDIIRYNPERKDEWNEFVRESKNGTFLFDRDYMDYHSDRFEDCSLMIFRRGKLYALLPADVNGDTLRSHGGLTYGGLVMSEKATTADIMAVLGLLNAYLKGMGVAKIIYKPVPYIYNRQPSEEDLYAIFSVCNARLTSRAVSSAIYKDCRNKWFRIRECGRKRAAADGIVIERTDNPDDFWQILSDNLGRKYDTKPVHTVEEIRLLMRRFPDKIRLFVAKKDGVTLGGTLLYLTERVVHSQYISASEEGKRLHALDLLFGCVIEEALREHDYFDFGISTEQNGTLLNEQLIYQKEGFGGRGVCYDCYEWTL